jgi:DNA-binding NtrC family response regulator
MGKQLKVLIVDDSPADAKLVAQALRTGRKPIEWERVEDASAMKNALTTESWDIITSDWTMPKFSAPAALRIVRDMGLDTPFIIVSGSIGEEFVVEAMRAGANDYVMKDCLARLAVVVEHELRELRARRL